MFWCVIVRTFTYGDVGGSHTLPRQSGVVHGFSRVTSIPWRFSSSRTTSFSHTNTIENTWRHLKSLLNTYIRMRPTPITRPTAGLRLCADPTTSTSSSSLSVKLETWICTPHLRPARSCLYVTVDDLWSPLSALQSSRSVHQVSLWCSHQYG